MTKIMLSLDSPRWSELEHAYGPASDIPGLLRQLHSLPTSEGEHEPWFSLWSSLAHQGDIYSASFAAVPHVVECLSQAPTKVDSAYFQFPAWVEVCRQKNAVTIPDGLEADYFAALDRLPSLVAAAAVGGNWDSGSLCCALSAIAASKRFGAVAEAVLEMNAEVAEEFLEWFSNR